MDDEGWMAKGDDIPLSLVIYRTYVVTREAEGLEGCKPSENLIYWLNTAASPPY